MKRSATLTASTPISLVKERLGDRYLWVVSLVFTGLAVTGKGFAYLLPAPFFISEMVLLVGLYVMLVAGDLRALFRLPQTYLMTILFLWGTYRTLPYIPKYQIDAIRDAMLFGYMAWAFVIGALVIGKPERLNMIIRWFPKFIAFFLVACPVAMLTYKFVGRSLPDIPWSPGNSFISIKAGDTCVMLGACLGYWVAGFMTKPVKFYYPVLLIGLLGFCGSINRGGLMAFMTVLGICVVCKPRSPWPWRVLGTLFLALALLFVTDIEITVPGTPRALSFDQMIENVLSIVGLSKNKNLDDTKEWRMAWWDTIFSYSLHGPYKWTGKGFGINLATDDGFQVGGEEAELRSPHNGHINMLARSGIPGLTLWISVIVTWAAQMAYCFIRSRHRRDGQWPNVFMWLFAVFCACNLNASVDVYLEGPMGGVPLWTIYGLGLASIYLYKYHPEILRHPSDPLPDQAALARAPGNVFETERHAPRTPSRPKFVMPVAQAGQPAQLAGFERVSRN